jgi:hypothetical protein
VADVTATGIRTKFGRTAELARTAHVASTQQKAVLRVLRNPAIFNGVLIVLLVAYAYAIALSLAEIIPLILTSILASIGRQGAKSKAGGIYNMGRMTQVCGDGPLLPSEKALGLDRSYRAAD